MKTPTCPFCNNVDYIVCCDVVKCSIPKFRCDNHKNKPYICTFSSGEIAYIELYSDNKILIFYQEKIVIEIYKENNLFPFKLNLPLIKNLTPENFEQKIKCYLTFQ